MQRSRRWCVRCWTFSLDCETICGAMHVDWSTGGRGWSVAVMPCWRRWLHMPLSCYGGRRGGVALVRGVVDPRVGVLIGYSTAGHPLAQFTRGGPPRSSPIQFRFPISTYLGTSRWVGRYRYVQLATVRWISTRLSYVLSVFMALKNTKFREAYLHVIQRASYFGTKPTVIYF